MNERIFQLVGQAISKVPVPITFNHKHSMFAEKFAELIVRECAEIALTDGQATGNFEVLNKITKHFGVEE